MESITSFFLLCNNILFILFAFFYYFNVLCLQNVTKAELSKNENKILTILFENKGQVVSRDTIMAKLWETDCFVDENTLSVNIARLRKTLSQIGIDNLIKTKKGLFI